jgi:predicted RNase H-like HicB family nuclease
MKTLIPCKIIYSKKDMCWYVESPGFYDGIMTSGETLEKAKAMAAEAVSGLLETYLEHGIAFTIPKGRSRKGDGSGWHGIEYPNGFFELFGSLKNVPFERPAQGKFQDDCPREQF